MWGYVWNTSTFGAVEIRVEALIQKRDNLLHARPHILKRRTVEEAMHKYLKTATPWPKEDLSSVRTTVRVILESVQAEGEAAQKRALTNTFLYLN